MMVKTAQIPRHIIGLIVLVGSVLVLLAALAATYTSAAGPSLSAARLSANALSVTPAALALSEETDTPSVKVYLPSVLRAPVPTPTAAPTAICSPTLTPPAAMFSAPVRIDIGPDILASTDPSLTVDRQGKVHIVWVSARLRDDTPEGVGLEVCYSRELTDGNFSIPISITVSTSLHSRAPAVAVDSRSIAHIVFRRGDSQITSGIDDVIYYVNNRNGVFSNAQIIATGGWDAAIAAGPGDVLHVLIAHAMYMNNRSGAFSAPVWVGSRLFTDATVMRLDSRGWPHFAILGRETMLADVQVYYVRPINDPLVTPAFATPVNVSQPGDYVDFWPGFALDAQDHAHIFWRDGLGQDNIPGGIWYANNVSGTFSQPARVALSGFAPHAAVDSEGGVHLIYRQGSDLAYKNNRSGAFDQPAVIAATPVYSSDGGSMLFYGRQPFATGPDGTVHLTYYNPEYNFHIYYVRGDFTGGSPLATPTPTATPGPSPTMTRTPTFTPAGIYGRVMRGGAPAANIPLALRQWTGSTYLNVASTTTDASGNFSFVGVASLRIGETYSAYCDELGADTLLYWATRSLDDYTAGSVVHIGDFDMADVALVYPVDGATVSLPAEFRWTPRPASPTDSYVWAIFNASSYWPWYWGPSLGYTGSHSRYSLPSGFNFGTQYTWYVEIHSPDGGYGASRERRNVTFTGAIAASSPVR